MQQMNVILISVGTVLLLKIEHGKLTLSCEILAKGFSKYFMYMKVETF